MLSGKLRSFIISCSLLLEFSLRSVSCSNSWSDHLLVHVFAFVRFLPSTSHVSSIIRSTRFDKPCLQQSRKKKTYYDCLGIFFEKNITRRMRRRFHEANIVGVPCKRSQHRCATLRRSQNNRNVGTCWAKSLTGFKSERNKCQHCCGSMQKDATSHNIAGPNNVECCWPTVLGPFRGPLWSVMARRIKYQLA